MNNTPKKYDDEYGSYPVFTDQLDGSISTNGKEVIGDGTSFDASMIWKWMYVYVGGSGQQFCRQIIDVTSATSAFLSEAFPDDIVAGTKYRLINNEHWTSITATVTSNNGAYINGVYFDSGSVVSWDKSGRDRTAGQDMIDPITIDANSATVIVTSTN